MGSDISLPRRASTAFMLAGNQRPALEVVRETQTHIPERAGVGQQLPRNGFAPIAAQIGDVTTQRIPDERVVTLEGRTVDPATLYTHRQTLGERVVHSDQHLLADQRVGQDALETYWSWLRGTQPSRTRSA